MSCNSFSRRTILKATAATGASVFATPLRAAAPEASPITPALIDAAKKEGALTCYAFSGKAGITTRSYNVCWDGGRIKRVDDLGMR